MHTINHHIVYIINLWGKKGNHRKKCFISFSPCPLPGCILRVNNSEINVSKIFCRVKKNIKLKNNEYIVSKIHTKNKHQNCLTLIF